jgi:GT2 family glycosyltransferase
MNIESKQYAPKGHEKFSILIPTWNNLPFLKLCVDSLRRHSAFPHQLIIHVNEGLDGTLDWVREQQIDHTFSNTNVGVCVALNSASKLAQTDFIVYFNDDMVALPGWDQALLDAMAPISHSKWFLSSTMIEPRYSGNSCVMAPHDFGSGVEEFKQESLLEAYSKIEFRDWSGATWPPNLVPRSLWEEVGGYSEEFSPGMSSDPDFSMKLWKVGVRHFQGVSDSRVYHFMAKSTGKVKKNPGPQQFLMKWGVSQGTFNRYYLRRGKTWDGPLPNPGPRIPLLFAILTNRIKGLIQRCFG